MTAKITIKQLEAFVAVADHGAFNRAAETLATTQPNISSRIAALEAALAIKLMDRDAGSVRLTSQGQDMLDHARRVLASLDDLSMAAGNAALIDGVLRLGVTEMIAHTWLRDFLKAMRTDFPNVSVEVTVDLSATIGKNLHQRRIDLALHNAPFAHDVDGKIPLGSWPLVWVAAPGLVPAQTAPLKAGDLVAQTVIMHSRYTGLHDEIAAHFQAMRHPAQNLVSSSNLAVCLHMAMEGFGVSAVPYVMASKALAQKTLGQVPYEWLPTALTFEARFEAHRSPAFVKRAASIAADIARSNLERDGR